MNWRSRCSPGANGNIIHIAIMTRGTIFHDADMIKYRAGEAKRESSGMANVTFLARWQMACRLKQV